MKIKLDERYYIENEQYGFVLRDKASHVPSKNKAGVITYSDESIGYYGTLQQATLGYLRVLMNNNIIETDMKGYIAEYQKQVDRITGMLPIVEVEHET